MDNSTDSLITARLLATARYTAVFNVLLFVLSAQRGGVWSAVQLVLAAVLLYYHIRIEFDRRVPSTKPYGKPACAVFQTTPPCRNVWRVRLPYGAKAFT